ncbi:hypothetical protein W97_06509 [Coniosporium apollinis CBS 100218]|uniref:Uncharacterized protein n=1 Tax=Coniosporium apollinis (strain CBS 100218) TaxID=1168221 RepID=R7Z017_CONA1|nr:uncharacterized protein W97_06509 [Coniosporium apollinis CBS 100218]EON67256.1 hypothetical protein W97_06509 [Coniosporium apollinis CBS 100218]
MSRYVAFEVYWYIEDGFAFAAFTLVAIANELQIFVEDHAPAIEEDCLPQPAIRVSF